MTTSPDEVQTVVTETPKCPKCQIASYYHRKRDDKNVCKKCGTEF